jgi:hypothetical protein
MKRTLIVLLSLITVNAIQAQIPISRKGETQRQGNIRTIVWKGIHSQSFSEAGRAEFLYFEGAIYNPTQDYLPTYFEKIKIGNDAGDIAVTLSDPVFEEFTEKEQKLIKSPALISTDIIIRSDIGYERKQSFALIELIPIRRNAATGKYEKLVSFGLDISTMPAANKLPSTGAMAYASNSVLASGEWYKIGVTSNGIYKISYDFLEQLGINVDAIDPRNLKIFGNGGGMLPEANSIYRYDDLFENAIFIAGENDGKLDPSDYILFYGEGPTEWKYQPSSQRFIHKTHLYADTTFYFITVETGSQGKRIANQASSILTPSHTVVTFDDFAFHELNAVNLIKSGREWYGEEFNAQSSFNFTFTFPNIDLSTPVHVTGNIVGRSEVPSEFRIASGTASVSLNPSPVSTNCYYCDFANPASGNFTFSPTGPVINLSVSKQTPSANGWLNYLEVNARRQLIMSGDQMLFRDKNSVGSGNIAEFNIGSSSAIQVWEITDPLLPRNQSLFPTSSVFQFTLAADTLREFIAFTGNSYLTPYAFGAVANQNLHGLGPVDMIIVSHPDFLQQANTLADLHTEEDNLTVIVVTPNQIYNEFSSGSQDICGIRDFVKMFYNRASTPEEIPRYLLLFGDGSYNNKAGSKNGNTNFIPCYQSPNSLSITESHVSDDFYGLLDDNEGGWIGNDLVDIGIGRFPVRNLTEAKNAVNKVLQYVGKGKQDFNCTAINTSPYRDWRNVVCFIGDDQDGGLHQTQANQLATFLDTNYTDLNIDKIFLDAFPQQATPGGQRYPDAVDAINNRFRKGALIINYTGHGGEVGLAHERIIGISQINEWDNFNNLPLFVTATCEFSRWDDPERTSAGEYTFLNPKGGSIALLTTTRLVYASPNFVLNQNFYNIAFEELNGEMPRLGDLYRLTKAASGSSVNNRNFTLLGDPALMLAYPKEKVYTTQINGNSILSNPTDTIKALSVVTISGYIGDENGNKLNSYNGILYPTVFDKAKNITTLSNDGLTDSPPMTFSLQKSILYKGKVNVTNGDFTFSFIVPKDIDFLYGNGRISYYAENGSIDASGAYERFIVGGVTANPPNDVTGPEIELYMNDEKFVTGGTTDENPLIYAVIKDSSGVNTTGSGIGHDLTANLDNNTDKSIVLNDYYETELNSYKEGSVRYPFSNLPEGRHTLQLKVWDVYNNSSTASTEFIVAKSAKLALDHVLNYPNPFTTKTSFYFEHNQACDLMDVQVQVFTISGKLVKTINTYVSTEGFRSEPIEWDGTDDFGDKIGRGIYIYRVKVRSEDGSTAEKFEKLVILN